MLRRDQVVQAKRIERGAIGNRKHRLQAVEWSERDELPGGVRRPKRHRCARENEAWSNRTRQDRANRRTKTAVIRRQQRIAAGQAGAATARGEEGIRTRAADRGRVTGSYRGVDESCLRCSDVIEGARNRIQSRNGGDSGRRSQACGNVAGEKTRFVSAALFEGEEEERPIAIEWSTKGQSVLSARERRIFDGSESIARLETAVS